MSSITALFGTVQIAANGVAQSFWSVAALMGTAMGLAFVPATSVLVWKRRQPFSPAAERFLTFMKEKLIKG